MDNNKDGGPAFPTGLKAKHTELAGGRYEGAHVTEFAAAAEGMTLRDYFAAKSMQAVLSGRVSTNIVPATCEQIARSAYKMADAMLRARED